ncbi:MAG: hypothetical protein ABJD53_17055 [Gammaproteobacteria bacterium]
MRGKILTTLFAMTLFLSYGDLVGAQGSSTSHAAEHIDACVLLLPSEISTVVHLPVDTGISRDAGSQPDGTYDSTCFWFVKTKEAPTVDPQAPLGGRSFVILHVIRWPAGSGLAHVFLDAFYQASLHDEIPGKPSPRALGDDALWWGDGLAVTRGDVGFGISVFPSASPHARPGIREEQLTRNILKKLDERAASVHRSGER